MYGTQETLRDYPESLPKRQSQDSNSGDLTAVKFPHPPTRQAAEGTPVSAEPGTWKFPCFLLGNMCFPKCIPSRKRIQLIFTL